jgi:Acyl-CoA reductase (LuxC)
MMAASTQIPVAHVIRGRVVLPVDGMGALDIAGGRVRVPQVDLDTLPFPRSGGFPILDLSLSQVLDFLAATGDALDFDTNAQLQWTAEALVAVNPIPPAMIEQHLRKLAFLFRRELMEFEHSEGLQGRGVGWRKVVGPSSHTFEARPFPSRMLHIMAGNAPANAALAIIRTALIGGTSVLKLPSNDPFSASAILRTMAELDPSHPIVRSISAAYWRGGDATVESVLVRPQFFDKVVAWGGQGAIENIVKYLGPGIELVSFDPKSSISMIGKGVHASAETLEQAAVLATLDVNFQEGCTSSRFQFVEGSAEQVDQYCERLHAELVAARDRAGGVSRETPADIRAEVDSLRLLEPDYRVWGAYDGSGLVVRSDEPVDFYPEARTVNVIRIDHLADALQYVNVATQTVGLYPSGHKVEFRDRLASLGGVDRVVDLGSASLSATAGFGSPHDGFYPLHRLARWIYCDA